MVFIMQTFVIFLAPLAGYSAGHAATVGSVLVTNLKTGAKKEGWDKAEVLFRSLYLLMRFFEITSAYIN